MNFKNYLLVSLSVIACFCYGSVNFILAGESNASEKQTALKEQLRNGIYLVKRKSLKQQELFPVGAREVLAENNQEILAPDERPPKTFMVLQKEPYIKLALGEKPLAQKDERAHTKLLIKLAQEQVEPLREFTHNNLSKEIAIVIGGKVVTSHKIKEEIKDGRFQISRCTDNGCAVIFSMLTEE